MSICSRWAILVLAVGLFFAPMAADAELLSYDGFAYGPLASDLVGNSGGFGFTSAWRPGGFNASVNSNYDIADGSLSFGDLLSSGGRVRSNPVTSIAGITRDLAIPLGTSGTTRYMSFLLRPERQLHSGAFNGFFGLVLEQPFEPELFVGKGGGGTIDRYVLEDRGGSFQIASAATVAVDETIFLVLKAEFTAGNDEFTLYVNPVPGAPEPLSGVVKNNSNVGTVAGFTIYSTGEFSLDELRLGTTYADVTPVPEPAGILCLGWGAVVGFRGIGCSKRVRRRGRKIGGANIEINFELLNSGALPCTPWIDIGLAVIRSHSSSSRSAGSN